jgi:hypothetical protein
MAVFPGSALVQQSVPAGPAVGSKAAELKSSRSQNIQQSVPAGPADGSNAARLKSWQSGVMRLIGHIFNLLLLPNPHNRLPTAPDQMIPLVLEP